MLVSEFCAQFRLTSQKDAVELVDTVELKEIRKGL